MSGLFRSTVLVSLSGAVVQGLTLLTQVLIARQFGAGSELDAFIAAFTVPQYVAAVIVTPLALYLMPVFMDYRHSRGEAAAMRLARSALGWISLSLLILTVAGLAARRPSLALLAPGLPPETLALASLLAVVLWPTVVLAGLMQLSTALYQSSNRFAWPALVAPIGAVATLLLLVVLASALGIVGLAVATTAGLGVQALLLLRGWLESPRRDGHRHGSGVVEIVTLAAPLMASYVLWHAFPMLERHFASRFGEGAISHLTYGFRIVSAEVSLVASGLAVVLFPRFVHQTISQRLDALRESFDDSFRYLSVLVVPFTVWTIVLAHPLVETVFQRGRFSAADTDQVTRLLQIYAIGLIPMALGTVTGRALYAMRAIYAVVLTTVLEMVLYWVSLAWLSVWLGIDGIAWARVIHLTAGLLLSVAYVYVRTPRRGRSQLGRSLLRTATATAISAVPAWLVASQVRPAPLALLLSGAVAITLYGVTLRLLRSDELAMGLATLSKHLRPRDRLHASQGGDAGGNTTDRS